MLILVANLGSTSFKYRLFRMPDEELLAFGTTERIGQASSHWVSSARHNGDDEGDTKLPDHSAAIDLHLKKLVEHGAIRSLKDINAIGFKAVHGGPISGAVRVTDAVIATMEQFADVAPAHNPPYIAAMKAFAVKLPRTPQVAAFETAFHQTIPAARQVYAIPHEWTEKLGIRRYGFHGASHRFIATRVDELLGSGKSRRIISCHLGGSSSLCAIENGKSVATSMGLTPQTGLPQNNRVGDFDTFALLRLTKHGYTIDDVLKTLGKEGGLLGISGVSNDMRDIEKAAAEGNTRAKLAIDAYVESVRHYIGAYLVALGGIDVLAFTGGIGENGIAIRKAICHNLGFAGIVLDANKNSVRGKEAKISAVESGAEIWIVPANEELIVARQTEAVLNLQ